MSNSTYYALFNNEYYQIKHSLSRWTVAMIETLRAYIMCDKKRESSVFTKTEALNELKKVSKRINDIDDQVLSNKLTDLSQKIERNENYIDSLIKLECSVGIYPNEFFLGRAKQLFYEEVILPIVWGVYEDEYEVDKQKKK